MNKFNNFKPYLAAVLAGLGLSVIGLTLYNFLTFERVQPPVLNSFKPKDLGSFLPKIYVVQSGSMEPAIKTGSIALVFPNETYAPGDVVTFSKTSRGKSVVTHRIGARLFPEGLQNPPTYLTAGDANEEFDKGQVNHEQIIGKVVLSVPYLGYLADFAKSPNGFLLLVIVPATIVIYEELKYTLKELKKLLLSLYHRTTTLVQRRRRGNDAVQPVNKGLGHAGSSGDFVLPSSAAIVPILGALVFMIGFSAGYFFDIEKSLGNILGAATSFDENGNGGSENGGTTVEGNPTCQSLDYTFGFKIDGGDLEEKTYTLTTVDGELTGGAPEDPDNSITIDNIVFEEGEKKFFDWLATLGIDAVIVKGGDNANVYVYDPEAFSDTGLHAPAKPPPPEGKFFEISHIEFCYDYDVVINEFLPNPTSPEEDWVELYSAVDSNISGYVLRDEATTDMAVLPANTFIGPSYGKYSVVDVGNRLNLNSDTIFLYNPAKTFLLDSISYGSNPGTDVSIGRDPDGTGAFNTCTTSSKGTSNTGLCPP